MNIEESIDRFGTVYFATELMDKAIEVTDGSIELSLWVSLVPDDTRQHLIPVLREAFEPLKRLHPCNDFKARMISEIQIRMVARMEEFERYSKQKWWSHLIKHGVQR